MNVIDVGAEETAPRIAQKLSAMDAGPVTLRVPAKRGASKWVAKIFSGDAKVSRAARGSALVACGYSQITGEIDANGDDVVKGIS
ncbi:MAG: hypothetical protein ACRELY_27350 [Polyangiaceae bacterium]